MGSFSNSLPADSGRVNDPDPPALRSILTNREYGRCCSRDQWNDGAAGIVPIVVDAMMRGNLLRNRPYEIGTEAAI